MPAGMVPLKLVVVAERWGYAGQQLDPMRIVLWRDAVFTPGMPERDESRTRAEILIQIPTPPSSTLEVTAGIMASRGRSSTRAFEQKARQELPLMLEEIRTQLQNQDERRSHPRYPANFPVRVFPLYSDGMVGTPISGRSEDLSLGGVRFITPTPVPTERLYVEFREIEALADHAIYARLLRSSPGPAGQGLVNICRFRGGTI
jgi:hypothetical protein